MEENGCLFSLRKADIWNQIISLPPDHSLIAFIKLLSGDAWVVVFRVTDNQDFEKRELEAVIFGSTVHGIDSPMMEFIKSGSVPSQFFQQFMEDVTDGSSNQLGDFFTTGDASAKITVGTFKKSLKHKFTRENPFLSTGPLTRWADMFDPAGRAEEIIFNISLSPMLFKEPAISTGSSIPVPKSVECDYQELVNRGQESHPLVKFTRLRDTKANELLYVYSQDNPQNKGKDMVKQWRMAQNTLAGGIKELHQVIAYMKMDLQANWQLIPKLEVLHRDLRVLHMKYEDLVAAQSETGPNKCPRHVITLRKFTAETYLSREQQVLHLLEVTCEKNPNCLGCLSRKPACSIYQMVEDEEQLCGNMLKYAFYLLLVHPDEAIREISVKIFRDVYLADSPDESLESDLQAMMATSGKNYYKRLEKRGGWSLALLKQLAHFKAATLRWLVEIPPPISIFVHKTFWDKYDFAPTEDCRTKKMLMVHWGLVGIVAHISLMMVYSLRESPAELCCQMWIFNTEVCQTFRFMESELDASAWEEIRFLREKFGPLLQRVWPLARLSDYNPRSAPLLPTARTCSVCQAPVQVPEPAYVLMRPDRARRQPVIPQDFMAYERRIVYECSMNCHLANLACMLPPVNNIIQELKSCPTGSPARLYDNWAAVTYLTERCNILGAFVRSRGFVLENGAFIPEAKTCCPEVVSRLKLDTLTRETLRYVDNLLLHGPDLECGKHAVVWQGTVFTPRRKGEAIQRQCQLRLLACPSIDAQPVPAAETGVVPWLSDRCVAYLVNAHEVSTAFLRDQCRKRVVESLDNLDSLLKPEFPAIDIKEKDAEYPMKRRLAFLLLWQVDYRTAQVFGILAVRNSSRQLCAFVPHCPAAFWAELTKGLPNIHILMHEKPVNKFSVLKIFKKERDIAYAEIVKEAQIQNPYSRLLFKHLHFNEPAPPAPGTGGLIAAPFQAAHLIGCPHKIQWKGLIAYNAVWAWELIPGCSFSAWALECPQTFQEINQSKVGRSLPTREPPPNFWALLPKKLTFVAPEESCRDRMEAALTPAAMADCYSFVVESGSLPDVALRFFSAERPSTAAYSFIFKEETDEQPFMCVCLELVERRLVGIVIPNQLCSLIYQDHGMSFLSIGSHDEINHLFTQHLNRSSGCCDYSVMGPCAMHADMILPDKSPADVLWSGHMEICYLFTCPQNSVLGLEQAGFHVVIHLNKERVSVCPNEDSSASPLEEVNCIRNCPFKADSGHQVFGMHGAILGSVPAQCPLQFGPMLRQNHTFLAVSVSRKLVDSSLFQLKKCFYFTFLFQDSRYLLLELVKQPSSKTLCLFGFFVPEGTTWASLASRDISELENKFLVLKFEEKLGKVLGLFPKELAKRRQLLKQAFQKEKDTISISTHIKKFETARKKAKEDAKNRAAKDEVVVEKSAGQSEVDNSIVVGKEEVREDLAESSLMSKNESDRRASSEEENSTSTNPDDVKLADDKLTELDLRSIRLLEKLCRRFQAQQICWNCSLTKNELEGIKLLKCSGCRIARYCSAECQLVDWNVHSPWCIKKQEKAVKVAQREMEGKRKKRGDNRAR